jgi:hypothetical protein
VVFRAVRQCGLEGRYRRFGENSVTDFKAEDRDMSLQPKTNIDMKQLQIRFEEIRLNSTQKIGIKICG